MKQILIYILVLLLSNMLFGMEKVNGISLPKIYSYQQEINEIISKKSIFLGNGIKQDATELKELEQYDKKIEDLFSKFDKYIAEETKRSGWKFYNKRLFGHNRSFADIYTKMDNFFYILYVTFYTDSNGKLGIGYYSYKFNLPLQEKGFPLKLYEEELIEFKKAKSDDFVEYGFEYDPSKQDLLIDEGQFAIIKYYGCEIYLSPVLHKGELLLEKNDNFMKVSKKFNTAAQTATITFKIYNSSENIKAIYPKWEDFEEKENITSGAVIINGKYTAPPYEVKMKQWSLLVNNEELMKTNIDKEIINEFIYGEVESSLYSDGIKYNFKRIVHELARDNILLFNSGDITGDFIQVNIVKDCNGSKDTILKINKIMKENYSEEEKYNNIKEIINGTQYAKTIVKNWIAIEEGK